MCRRPRPPRSPGLFFQHQQRRRFRQSRILAAQLLFQLEDTTTLSALRRSAARRSFVQAAQHLLTPLLQVSPMQALATQKASQLLLGQLRRLEHGFQLFSSSPVLRPTGCLVSLLVHTVDSSGSALPARQGALADPDLSSQRVGAGAAGGTHLLNHLRFERFGVLHYRLHSPPPLEITSPR